MDIEDSDPRWGKRAADGRPYLVDGHLIDTGVVAELLWDRYFEPNTRQWFTDRLGPDARNRFALLAATHDCGKLAPTFQCRLLDSSAPRWAPQFRAEDLDGWPGTDSVRSVNRRHPWYLGHATESGRTLERSGADPWWSRVVEGHHGRFPPLFDDEPGPTLQAAQRSIENSSWPAMQRRVLERVTEVFNPGETFEGLERPELEALSAAHVAGWVSVADWLASDEQAVESGIAEQSMIEHGTAGFADKRRAYFSAAVDRSLGSAWRSRS